MVGVLYRTLGVAKGLAALGLAVVVTAPYKELSQVKAKRRQNLALQSRNLSRPS